MVVLHARRARRPRAPARTASTGSRGAGRGRRPRARPRRARSKCATPSVNERSVSAVARSPMWWPTHARVALGEAEGALQLGAAGEQRPRRGDRQRERSRARTRASGAAAAGRPPTARTTESSVRMWIGRSWTQERVGDARQALAARRRRGRRSARRRRCRWSCTSGPPASAEQQVVQRRVGQHHAELGAARRDRRRDRRAGRRGARTIGRSRPVSSAASASRQLDERARRLEVGRHQGERLVLAVLARAQRARRPPRRRRRRRGGSRRGP